PLRPSGFGGQGKTKIKLYGVTKETIALRIPNYKLVDTLLKKTNLPLTGTSANISGKPASIKIKEILQQFQNQKHQPDLIIDVGNLKLSKPSKVIDLTGFEPKILRK
ncbi:MAG: Sua5/YciO/YrdC/YwlC family protein, partial [Ignavibacteria bacterium]|nr:Sua5/YciO/YrdC/YwlC family protein [Ignavibacteria bacterium]